MEQLRKMFLSLALLLTSTIMYAQSEISGTVVDTSGEAVIGATVKEKGTSNGTNTGIACTARHEGHPQR